MRRSHCGIPLYERRLKAGVQKPGQWTPQTYARYAWRVGQWIVVVHWYRHEGYSFSSAWRDGSGTPGEVVYFPDTRKVPMKRFTISPPAPDGDPTPSAPSILFKKHPRTTAFLSDRWYDDKSPRLPGSLWIDSDLGGFKAMLKEPSAMICARIRAATLDDLFSAIETFLGLDTPPWEIDQYALSKAPKNPKKKK